MNDEPQMSIYEVFSSGRPPDRKIDWALRRAEVRKREERLDSYSDPPEVEWENPTREIVLEEGVVGEWRYVEPEEPVDAVAIYGAQLEPFVDIEESRRLGEGIRERRKEQLKMLEAEEHVRLLNQQAEDLRWVQKALKKMDARDEREARARERQRQIALGLLDWPTGRKTQYPFGPPTEKPQPKPVVTVEPVPHSIFGVPVPRPLPTDGRVRVEFPTGQVLLFDRWLWEAVSEAAWKANLPPVVWAAMKLGLT